jgi:hypothetical protein
MVSSTARTSRDNVASSIEGWFWDGSSLWLRVPARQTVSLAP